MYDSSVQIETGKRVQIRVHLAVVGGDTIEKSEVEYIQGSGKMLPGLESALEGLEAGAKKSGVLDAKHAFGNPALSPHKTMKRSEFPKEAQLVVGERFAAKGVTGIDVMLAIEKIEEEDIDVRLMHPLADKDIRYEVEVLSVTDPAPPPLPPDALNIEEA